MNKIDEAILEIDKVICSNISRFDETERGLLSQNILSQLRNFVEYISLKIYSDGNNIEDTYDNITLANAYVKSRGDLKFLNKFHKLLQITASHYTLDEENSERLMLKYYEYLLRIKSFLKKTYNLDILKNIDKFPMETDSALKEYYKKIAEKINQQKTARIKSSYNDRYYIQKIKPFFIEYEVYYEVTFTMANDRASKFDRIIAYTKFDILPNYAVKLTISNDYIDVLDKRMPIQIIDKWEVSIRPCELNNFAKVFGIYLKIQTGNTEYSNLMTFLTKTGINLVEIIDSSEDNYRKIKDQIVQKLKSENFFDVLDISRQISKNNTSGSNVVRYLLYKLNNKIIKRQYTIESCGKLSNLYLNYGCIPFDKMPFITSLIYHNPKLHNLFDCIVSTNREHELLARNIKNNTETKGQLYTHRKDIIGFDNIDILVQKYNIELYYPKHTDRRLEIYKDHFYIKGYEDDTYQIIQKLINLSSTGIKNYSSSVDSWLKSSAYQIDSPEKEIKLKLMFENSKVALIYGSAGTGKSTMINHVSNLFNYRKKLYLANTNPAVDNLKRKVNAANCIFKTISKYLSSRDDTEFDLLIIDECSTVSNSDMLKVLKKTSFKLLILVGDTFQIESIRFGNWFSMATSFVPATSVIELISPYRTTNPKLLNLWNKVRNVDSDILEHIARNGYSITLDESIFDHTEYDEIILCLNYDGLYGINNINRFLQENNKSSPKQWGVQTYKVNDPILFNESNRFEPLIYNNLKGKIVGIEIFDDKIQFDVELDKAINQLEAEGYDFQLMDNSKNINSVIRFFVNKHGNTDEDDDSSSITVVPFQIAYAVSIHKAQGLEYNSVKVVITKEIEEMITHNIFYTAITRAKEKLKIYWTPETEKIILSSLKKRDSGKDVALLSSKYYEPIP